MLLPPKAEAPAQTFFPLPPIKLRESLFKYKLL